MNADERAIRDLVSTWLDATQRGDFETVLSLMDNDVIFMVPGQEPFGKEAWSERMKGVQVEGKSDIKEIKVFGEWAWLRQWLTVTVTNPKNPPVVLAGYTLGILRKKPDGKWVLARDANLVMPQNNAD